MLFSKEKLNDIELRNDVLYCLEVALRIGEMKLAREFGETSRLLKERIDHGDYSERDARRERVDFLLEKHRELYDH